MILEKQDFKNVIKQYPNDYEKFCYLRDNFVFNNKKTGLDFKCQICGNFYHDYKNCELLKFIPNYDKKIYNLTMNKD